MMDLTPLCQVKNSNTKSAKGERMKSNIDILFKLMQGSVHSSVSKEDMMMGFFGFFFKLINIPIHRIIGEERRVYDH